MEQQGENRKWKKRVIHGVHVKKEKTCWRTPLKIQLAICTGAH